MSRVVVLGAGASYGATLGRDVACPLVDWFFDAAERLGLTNAAYAGFDVADEIARQGGDIRAVDPEWGTRNDSHLGALLGLIHEQLGVAPRQYSKTRIDVERVMGLIEAELLGAHSMRRLTGRAATLAGMPADHLEQQMYFVICGVLIKATAGLECPHHASIARWLSPDDAVISFNYEQLMDRALRSRPDWNMADGYMMPFTRIGQRVGDRVDWRVKPEAPNGRPNVPLLKPHGSLNWLVPKDPWETNLNLQLDASSEARVQRIRRAQKVIYCLEDMHAEFEHDFPLLEWWARYEHDEEDYALDLHSLIVPPAITKPYRDLEPVVGHLWALAAHELITRCRELYFVGYSLREGDIRSSWLFRKAASEGKIERVVVVDPSDDVFGRVQRVFANQRVERGPQGIVEFAASVG